MDNQLTALQKLCETANTWETQSGARIWPKPMPPDFDMSMSVQAIRGSMDAAIGVFHKALGKGWSWGVSTYEGDGPAAHVAHDLEVKCYETNSENCGRALFLAVVQARIDLIENPREFVEIREAGMENKTLDQIKGDIDLQVKDVADYLCSRGDTAHLRKQVEERTRRTLYALSVKGWAVEKRRD